MLDVKKYFQNKLFSDVTFVIGETKIPAHRFVLATCSPVFAAMLYGDLKEKNNVVISDICVKSFLGLLQYIYTKSITLEGETVLEILYLSKKYEITPLVEECYDFLEKSLSLENVFTILSQSIRWDEKELSKKCHQFINQQDPNEVLTSKDFVNVEKSELLRFVCSDDFGCDEVKLFQSCIAWATHQYKTIPLEKSMADILPHIRFPLMSIVDISTIVFPKNLLSSDQLTQLFAFVGSNGITGNIQFPNKPRNLKFQSEIVKLFGELINSTEDEVITTTKISPSGKHSYKNLTIKSTGKLTCSPWNGQSGGKLIIFVKNKLIIEKGGQINTSSLGYRGGDPAIKARDSQSSQGESYQGVGRSSSKNNFGGGGGGPSSGSYGSIGGGGGGYGTKGLPGNNNQYNGINTPGGDGGECYGESDLRIIYFGSGGGGGSPYNLSDGKPRGGQGGGIIVIFASEIENHGNISADGENGVNGSGIYCSGGGGGSGGSIFIQTRKLQNWGRISCVGGEGGQHGDMNGNAGICSSGGRGGDGRIRIDGVYKDEGVFPKPLLGASTPINFMLL